MQNRMRNGIFMAPFHPVDEDPTMALARDLELVEWLDRLGYDEAWIGEHHSAGFEIIASPELFIAAVAERTRHIRLGTGVVSLPYHNPLMTANRIIQLDHMTRGRVMFGAGPGLLPSDASMLGIDPSTQRDRMAEALDVILRLFAGETVSETTEWYTLNEARLHLLPYSDPYPEVAVASSITPSGGRLAGKYDLGMLCVAATQAGGFDALGENWKIANEIAQETRGKPMDPRRLRLVGPVHIAETREKARENVQFGIHKWLDYFSRINPTSSAQVDNRGGDPVDTMIASGSAVIGTADDAVAQIRRLQDKQGDFGCFLQLAHNWADFDSTKKSYELWQRYVMPQLTGANRNRDISLEWTTEHGERLMGGAMKAAMEMFEKHQKEQAAKAKEEAS